VIAAGVGFLGLLEFVEIFHLAVVDLTVVDLAVDQAIGRVLEWGLEGLQLQKVLLPLL